MSRLGFALTVLGLLGAGSASGQNKPAPLDTVRPANRVEHRVLPGPRRWRGMVGRQPVTLELDSTRFGWFGSYYYDRHGRPLRLGGDTPKPGNPLRLTERTEEPYKVTGTLEFSKPISSDSIQIEKTW